MKLSPRLPGHWQPGWWRAGREWQAQGAAGLPKFDRMLEGEEGGVEEAGLLFGMPSTEGWTQSTCW